MHEEGCLTLAQLFLAASHPRAECRSAPAVATPHRLRIPISRNSPRGQRTTATGKKGRAIRCQRAHDLDGMGLKGKNIPDIVKVSSAIRTFTGPFYVKGNLHAHSPRCRVFHIFPPRYSGPVLPGLSIYGHFLISTLLPNRIFSEILYRALLVRPNSR